MRENIHGLRGGTKLMELLTTTQQEAGAPIFMSK